MDYAYQAKCFRLLLPHRTTFPRRFSLYLVMQVAKKETWTNQNSKLAELYHRWNKASIVKTCFGHLAPQLENNFEISLFQSIFPEQLKIANEKIESGNYRPISHCGFAVWSYLLKKSLMENFIFVQCQFKFTCNLNLNFNLVSRGTRKNNVFSHLHKYLTEKKMSFTKNNLVSKT